MISLNQISIPAIKEYLSRIDKKTWIKMAVVTGIGLVFIIFIAWPAWITRFEMRQRLKDMKDQITAAEELIHNKPELYKNAEKYKRIIKDAQEGLFGSAELSLLLGTVSKLATDAGVTIIASNPKEFKDEFPEPFNAKYEAALYDFSVEGTYHQLGDFTARIESNPKILRIQNFHVSPEKKGKSGIHSARYTISAVSIKENAK